MADNITHNMTTSQMASNGETTPFNEDAGYHFIFTYLAPILIVGGTVGNVLSLIVLQTRYFRHAPSSFLLSALAVADLGVIYTGFVRQFLRATFITYKLGQLQQLTTIDCQLHFFFMYFFTQLSPWTLALLTVERLFSVVWPLHARTVCSRLKIGLVWGAIVLCLAGLNLQTFFTMIYDKGCNFTKDAEYFGTDVWPWLDLTLVTLLPFCIILSCNCVIIHRLCRAKKFRQGGLPTKDGSGDDTTKTVTMMLVGISIVFLITTTPSGIFIAFEKYWPYETNQEKYDYSLAFGLTLFLFYCNNCINFLLYCVTGAKFRMALCSLCRCCRGVDADTKGTTSTSKTVSSANSRGRSTQMSAISASTTSTQADSNR